MIDTILIILYNITMIKKICILLFSCSLLVFASKSEPIPTFVLDGVIDSEWGDLVAVFDQKNSQRLTFDNDGVITLVSLHLTWSSKENAFVPKVRQVIQLTEK